MKPRPKSTKPRRTESSAPQGVGPYRARFLRGVKGSDPIFSSPIPQIAFVGRSNVGKSSTINALLGVSGLARTSQTPGKTQEINFFSIGDSVYFVDLPGYGYAKMPEKDAEAIRKHIVWYLSGGEAHPRLLVLIIDGRHELSPYDRELLALAREESHPLLVLLNKVDTLNQKERSAMQRYFAAELADVRFVPFSAKTKEGVDEVRAILFAK